MNEILRCVMVCFCLVGWLAVVAFTAQSSKAGRSPRPITTAPCRRRQCSITDSRTIEGLCFFNHHSLTIWLNVDVVVVVVRPNAGLVGCNFLSLMMGRSAYIAAPPFRNGAHETHTDCAIVLRFGLAFFYYAVEESRMNRDLLNLKKER